MLAPLRTARYHRSMTATARLSPSQPLALPGRKTASGGLQPWTRHRVGRTRLQPTDASGKNRPRYDLARRGAVLPQKVTLDPSCANNPVAKDPAVQAKALSALGKSVSGNPAGTAEWAFMVSEPYIGSGNWTGNLFTEGRRSEISGERIGRESPSALGNLLTGYYPTSTLVHAHPNNAPPSGLSDNDLNLGIPVIAIDKAGTFFCGGR